jgi:hypothetical protein
MNFLNHLSWTSYFEAVMLLLGLYYTFIGFRFYAGDIRQLFKRSALRAEANQRIPDQLLFNGGEMADDTLPEEASYLFASHSDTDIRQADELIASLKECIKVASDKAYAPDALVLQFKAAFKGYPALKTSPHRPAINELVVTECERTGVAELTEDKVDQWWSD